MSETLFKLSYKFVLTCVGLLFLGSIPALFVGITPHFGQYFHSILAVIKHLIHPSRLTYTIGSELLRSNGTATARPAFSNAVQLLALQYDFALCILFYFFYVCHPADLRNDAASSKGSKTHSFYPVHIRIYT